MTTLNGLTPVGRSIDVSPRRRTAKEDAELDSLVRGLSAASVSSDAVDSKKNENENSSNWMSLIYGALLLVRAACALLGTGYLHPDEHFQTVEVVAGDVLHLQTFAPWEFDPAAPIRSIVPIGFTLGPLLALFQGLNTSLAFFGLPTISAGLGALLVSRLSFFILSLSLDAAIYRLLPPKTAWRALLLLSTSSAVLVYSVRPFTNSIEAAVVAWCLVFVADMTKSEAGLAGKSFRLGALLAVGIFTRLTFAASAVAVGLGYLVALRRRWLSTHANFPTIFSSLFALFVGLTVTGALIVVLDTIYFGHCTLSFSYEPIPISDAVALFLSSPNSWHSFHISFHPIITPYNFLLYNVDPLNLATHGLHPRYLHALVNMPMLYGPLYLFVILKLVTLRGAGFLRLLSLAIVGMNLAVLSAFPHQEARFLVPLVIPMIISVYARGDTDPARTNNGQASGKPNGSPSSRPPRFMFWLPWLVFNLAATVLLGFAHQGGILPALFSVPMEDRTSLTFWKSYMPPRYPLSIPRGSQGDPVYDLMGRPQEDIAQILAFQSHDAQRKEGTALLFAPKYAAKLWGKPEGTEARLVRTFSPHVNLDDVGLVWEMVQKGQISWKDAFEFGVWELIATDVPRRER